MKSRTQLSPKQFTPRTLVHWWQCLAQDKECRRATQVSQNPLEFPDTNFLRHRGVSILARFWRESGTMLSKAVQTQITSPCRPLGGFSSRPPMPRPCRGIVTHHHLPRVSTQVLVGGRTKGPT